MQITVKSAFENAKLRYVLDYIFVERFGCNYELNPDIKAVDSVKIGYGISENVDIAIPNSGFLQENEIINFEPEVKIDNKNQIFVFPSDLSSDLPFDIFSAIFFFLSRYEEYVNTDRDLHQRFDCQHSFAYKNGFHNRAVVDEWVMMLRKHIAKKFPKIVFKTETPSISLTIDVDMMFSYQTKGLVRNVAAAFRDFFKGNFRNLIDRKFVLLGLRKDPFNTFDKIENICKKNDIVPIFFILCSKKRTAFDKNGNIRKKKSVEIIKRLKTFSEIGLHPSYYSMSNKENIFEEKKLLEEVLSQSVSKARFHFLRINIPKSYLELSEAGFTDDYTMGFASKEGFRAGTTRPFRFFDLLSNKVLPLTIHPFSVMDGSLRDYQKLSLQESEKILMQKISYIKSTNGCFQLLIHNDIMSEKGRWSGWSKLIENVLETFKS